MISLAPWTLKVDLSVWVLSTARTPWHVMTIGDNLETEQLPWLKNATSHNPLWCFVARRHDSLKHHTTNHETKSWKKTSILSDICILGQVPKQITLFIETTIFLLHILQLYLPKTKVKTTLPTIDRLPIKGLSMTRTLKVLPRWPIEVRVCFAKSWRLVTLASV